MQLNQLINKLIFFVTSKRVIAISATSSITTLPLSLPK